RSQRPRGDRPRPPVPDEPARTVPPGSRRRGDRLVRGPAPLRGRPALRHRCLPLTRPARGTALRRGPPARPRRRARPAHRGRTARRLKPAGDHSPLVRRPGLGPEDNLVYAVAIHVHDLELVPGPLEPIARNRRALEMHHHEPADGLVVSALLVGERWEVETVPELIDREEPVDEPRSVVPLYGRRLLVGH